MVATLQWFEIWTWIQESYNGKIVGDGVIQPSHVMCMVPNISSTMVLIKPNVTEKWYNAIKQISKLIYLNSRQRKINHAHTSSNASTIKENIKWTATHVHSRSIDLTKNGTQRNIRNFEKTEVNQSAQLWPRKVHDFKRLKIFHAEHLKEQNTHGNNSRK